MEIWFVAAVLSAFLSGIGNFIFKVAAHRNYSSELFSMYGGLTSVTASLPAALYFSGLDINWFPALISFLAGTIAAVGGIIKVYALRHVDTTIYFPLYKLVSPTLAILFGVVFFYETFSSIEWVGLALGLLVPLLLINGAEHSRQNNLVAGLVLLFIGAVISATAAALNKYSTVIWDDVLWLLMFATLGVFIGSLFTVWWKNGFKKIKRVILDGTDSTALIMSSARALVMCVATGLGLYAFTQEGTLAIVHTIQSMYILVPIVLSIVFYNEHWNLQKVVAITLSIAALGLLG